MLAERHWHFLDSAGCSVEGALELLGEQQKVLLHSLTQGLVRWQNSEKEMFLLVEAPEAEAHWTLSSSACGIELVEIPLGVA